MDDDEEGWKEHWDFSIDTMAKYDFPAMIDYVSDHATEKVSVIAQNIGGSIALDSMASGVFNDLIDNLLVLQPCFVMDMGLFGTDEESKRVSYRQAMKPFYDNKV